MKLRFANNELYKEAFSFSFFTPPFKDKISPQGPQHSFYSVLQAVYAFHFIKLMGKMHK